MLFVAAGVGTHAAVFGTGTNSFSLEFVSIGNPDNPPDEPDPDTGDRYGAVPHTYEIGIHEIAIHQFEKANAMDGRIGDGNEGYWNDGIRTVGTNAPVGYATWYEAARFANWLSTGDAFAGAYAFDTNGVLVAVNRASTAVTNDVVYVLPTEAEWYKAAYYKPINDGSYTLYSNGSNSVPVHGTTNGWNFIHNDLTVNEAPNYMWEVGFGGEEQNGTYDMNGNVWEWCEGAADNVLDDLTEGRMIRDGSALDSAFHMKATRRHGAYDPLNEHELVGFRVAAVPSRSHWVTVSVVGSGTVGVASGWVSAGTNLALVAEAQTNWLFMGWSGDLTGDFTTAGTNVVVDQDIAITATFSEDADGDGLTNGLEYAIGTMPRNVDSDGDGLSDSDEVNLTGTIPTNPDSDGDSFDDGLEWANGGDALASDAWRIDHIRSNGAQYNLFPSNSVLDLSLGQAGFLVSKGTAWLSLQLEKSENLVVWTNAGDMVIWSIPVDSSNVFYRVRSDR